MTKGKSEYDIGGREYVRSEKGIDDKAQSIADKAAHKDVHVSDISGARAKDYVVEKGTHDAKNIADTLKGGLSNKK